jgi:hypothetical protein
VLSRIGQASYAIYVLQIGWFSIALAAIVEEASTVFVSNRVAKDGLILFMIVLNLLVCVSLGVAWHERFLSPLDAQLREALARLRGVQWRFRR